ncbi:RIP metalloprotease RseP [Sphingomonas oleivorans]|uniref:Zinc metalloprotease n=1 Tax=Sphingomonas oleivorans TaxID=1735121 RepID=A0A2T5FYM0_9SPHN|nr:RIP metalloprotease RseP [Sphingomonas oleivorans]PTQ11615.1 RIP metalloprotease RseP [Sphingomonas oleivorans]
MIEGPGFLITVLSFLLVIGPLVFLHELGHYLAGRACGVKADVFSIGMGQEVVGWTDRRGTRWKIAWLPLGGYVKFAGDMNPANQPSPEWLRLPPEERAKTFQAKPLWQRFIIVAAGPIANFIVAIAIIAGFLIAYGEPRTPPVAAAISAGSPAAAAGLRAGDRIVSVAGRSVTTFDDIVMIVQIRPEEPLAIGFVRDGRPMNAVVTPAAMIERDRFGNEFRKGVLGVASGPRIIAPLKPHEVLGAAVRQTGTILRTMVDTIGQIITGRRSVKELGGPLKIAQISGQQATLGLAKLIMLIAMISINLGFINLLPIPMLDGGHLIFYVLEGIRRRPLPPQAQEWAFRSGLALLLGFMLFVTVNDLGSFGLWRRLAGLIG